MIKRAYKAEAENIKAALDSENTELFHLTPINQKTTTPNNTSNIISDDNFNKMMEDF